MRGNDWLCHSWGENPKGKNKSACFVSYLFVFSYLDLLLLVCCDRWLSWVSNWPFLNISQDWCMVVARWKGTVTDSWVIACMHLLYGLPPHPLLMPQPSACGKSDYMGCKWPKRKKNVIFNNCTQTSYCILYHIIRMPTHVSLRFKSPTPHSLPRCSGSICPGVMPRSACLARTSHKRARLCLRNPTLTDTKNIVECECFFLHQLIQLSI